jgi:hypothetical protein
MVEEEKIYEFGSQEERICFCKVYHLWILKGFDIQNKKKNPSVKEHEMKF